MPSVQDLPRGTVTFLFTDVEGSTALWERDRAAMAAAVARHLAVLRSCVSAQGGVLFKTVGDGTQSAFASAPAALVAALSAQAALGAEAMPEPPGRLRVRMALHTGEATPHDGDYLAAPLNRLARLLAAGHGGQILLTQATRQLIRDDLPDGAILSDLGEHRLRDLLEQERVWQASAAGLPAAFPALRSLTPQATNLPVQPTPLVGRREEVERLCGILVRRASPLLTLTGPGGTGKTRLALQAAAESLDAFPDGVWFVDLSPVSDPSLVLPAIAGVLGVREAAGQTLRESLIAYLQPKRLLLVVDNFEQVLSAAKDVAAFLAACPQLSILATSREALRIRGEQQVPVEPLAVPAGEVSISIDEAVQSPAVALFLQHAQAVRPDFALSPQNVGAVVGICRTLDGLPLAIELASARVKVLPPQSLLARLEQRLPLLTAGARDAPERQRTLRDAIAWSYDLLAAEDQLLFTRLGVFVGGAALEAIEAVANPDGRLDVLSGLASLIDKSLLRLDEREEEPRYGILETIHEFARERLEASGDEAALREAHAAHFLAWVELARPKFLGADEASWVRRFEREHPNFRQALDTLEAVGDINALLKLAGSLSDFWIIHSHLTEGRDRLEQALRRSVEPTGSRERALLGVGLMEWALGDLASAEVQAREAEALAQALDDKSALWQAISLRGYVAEFQHDDGRAVPFYQAALAIARELNDSVAIGNSLDCLSDAAFRRGDLDEAERLVEEAVSQLRMVGQGSMLGYALSTFGQVALARGEVPQAVAAYQEELTLAQNLGSDGILADALAGFAAVATASGQYTRAAQLLGATDAIGTASYHPRLTHYFQLTQTTQAVRAALGEAVFDTEWQAGRAVSSEEAVALARSVTTASASSEF